MGSVIEVRRLGSDQWRLLREVRLKALQDSPSAFSKTYAQEAAYPEADWIRRIGSHESTPAALWVVAEELGHPVGLACGRFETERPWVVNVFSMWVEPACRRRGAGSALLAEILEWAKARGASQLVLGVLSSNESAVRLYRSHGFVVTHENGPEGQPQSDGLVMVRAC
jgi:ribosomal protein S18 acetylase RimI-like enzyme